MSRQAVNTNTLDSEICLEETLLLSRMWKTAASDLSSQILGVIGYSGRCLNALAHRRGTPAPKYATPSNTIAAKICQTIPSRILFIIRQL